MSSPAAAKRRRETHTQCVWDCGFALPLLQRQVPAENDTRGYPGCPISEFYADKLRGGLGVVDADACSILRGHHAGEGAASIQDMLERSRFAQGKSVAIRLDPPPEGGGETLFQPVGKALLEAKKRGWIDQLQALLDQDGLGFYVVLAGKPEREGAQGPCFSAGV